MPKFLKYSAFLLLVIAMGAIVFIKYPVKAAQAEIATGQDWMSIFPVDADSDNPNYGNKIYVNCSNSPGSRTPMLQSNSPCSLTTPANPGLYEVRFMANDSFLPMAISAPFWVKPVITPNATCFSQQAVVGLSWPSFVGINGDALPSFNSINTTPNNPLNASNTLIVWRKKSGDPSFSQLASISPKATTYSDQTVAQSVSYSYYITTQSNLYGDTQTTDSNGKTNCTNGTYSCTGGYPPAFTLPSDPTPATVTTQNCYKPYLQTTQGDVHTNHNLNVPGGPP